MPNFSGRFKALRKRLGLSQAEFAEKLGISRNYVGMIEGGHEPSDTLMRLVTMLETQRDAAAAEGDAPEPLREDPAPYGAGVDIPRMRKVPLLSWAQAGEAVSFDELPVSWQERIATETRDARAFAIALRGDSMEPKFSSGDVVIVTPTAEPHSGELVIAKLKSEGVMFKLVHFEGAETVLLTSYNPAFPTQKWHRKDFHWIYPVESVWKRLRR
jgi:phage repressor protein C with HTH and peptisase S24 domain